jgi:putative flippase GtrA
LGRRHAGLGGFALLTPGAGRHGNLADSALIPAVRVSTADDVIDRRAARVSAVRKLYERFRLLIHEGAKFGLIGAIGVVIYNIVNGWLHFTLHLGPLTSATIAVVVTTLTSYIANRYWSFRHRERTTVPRETVMFFALNGVGLVIQWAVVGFTYYGLGETGKLANVVANNVGILLGTLFRFWSYRKWVWAAPQPAPEGHEAIEPALSRASGQVDQAPSTGDEAGKPH